MSDERIDGINFSLNISYSPEQFIRLAQEIAEQGGEHVDDLCSSRAYQFSGPNPDGKALVMPGCGNYSIFEFPYDSEDGEVLTLGTIKACAVCDALGWKPRFAHVMESR